MTSQQNPTVTISQKTTYTAACTCGLSVSGDHYSPAQISQARQVHLEWHERGDTGPVWEKIRPDLPDAYDCEVCGARMRRFQPGDWPFVDSRNHVHTGNNVPGHISELTIKPGRQFDRYLTQRDGR